MRKHLGGTLATSLIAASLCALVAGTTATGSSTLDCSPIGSIPGRSSGALSTPHAPATPSPEASIMDLDGSVPGETCSSPGPSGAPTADASLPASPDAEATVEVQAFDPYFTPKEIRLAASGPSRIVLTNRGYVGHNLTVDELAVQLVAGRGGTDEVVLIDPSPGTYTFYCSVSGHREAGMEGTLIVE